MGFGGPDFFGGPMSLGQFEYMAEAEGQDDLVDTIDARFNAAINQMKSELSWAKGSDYDGTAEVNNILMSHGISPSELTPAQVRRIQRVIA